MRLVAPLTDGRSKYLRPLIMVVMQMRSLSWIEYPSFTISNTVTPEGTFYVYHFSFLGSILWNVTKDDEPVFESIYRQDLIMKYFVDLFYFKRIGGIPHQLFNEAFILFKSEKVVDNFENATVELNGMLKFVGIDKMHCFFANGTDINFLKLFSVKGLKYHHERRMATVHGNALEYAYIGRITWILAMSASLTPR